MYNVYMYMCICAYMYCVFVYISTYSMYVCMYVYMCLYLHVCIYVCICLYIGYELLCKYVWTDAWLLIVFHNVSTIGRVMDNESIFVQFGG